MIKDLITQIPESYFDIEQEGQVEIIGWLYQYYNTELKDLAFKKKNYTTTDIPAVTQLFTPDWIVKYLVQNSLGRYWINVLQSQGDHLSEKQIARNFSWDYYMPDVKQETDFSKTFSSFKKISVDQITFLDPAMGSGHILVYAFDVFMQIYNSLGYSQREAARKIVENNLYGLDIDTRAFQLSYFALMMKVRQYDRHGLDKKIKLNIADIPESDFNEKQLDKLTQNKSINIKNQLQTLINEFENGDDLGSIIKIDSQIDLKQILSLTEDDDRTGQISFEDLELENLKHKLINIVKTASLLSQKYTISVTNPPYMGSGKMNQVLKKYVQKKYPDSKADLFSVFMEKVGDLTSKSGYFAMITQHSWMFLSSFEALRKKLQSKTIINMAHLGPRAFEEIGGEVVQSTAFVMFNQKLENYIGTYERLINYNSQRAKEEAYLSAVNDNKNKISFFAKQTNFSKIPGNPIAYWASKNLIHDFEIGTSMDEIVDARQGLATADNNRFLRQWFEVAINNICFNAKSLQESLESRKKWFPYNKGGSYRKWYGNYDYVVNWENDGYEIKNFKWSNGKNRSVIRNPDYYFREAITWSALSSGSISFRYTPTGFLFDTKGPELFSKSNVSKKFIISFLNSKVTNLFLGILAPTLDFNPGSISRLAFISKIEDSYINNCEKISATNIKISRQDWDSFETSWNFKHHPLLNHIAEHNRFPPPLKAGLKKFLICNCAKNVPKHNKMEVKNGKLS
ncbi:BREX-1 system adenine-specific DNA-methyltransferase PglX [Liquorilactobacillus vini]|uniref:BREX-1 system adenine-specific DNA-methyltransferase PglX n=1 Tax=Liquorilactobacillus vini TaxID=238015 RepID=UPI00159EBB18|nr:BREX-1 system adenine-specific DNA-methyltransferase PglX [Liquorilactobacillus vini]